MDGFLTKTILSLYNDCQLNKTKQIIVLLILIDLFIFFAYNNKVIEITYNGITITTVFFLISLIEIYYYYYNNARLANTIFYSFFSNALISYYYNTINNYYNGYSNYILSYKQLYLYNFDLKGLSVCEYKIHTLWLEQITLLIIIGFLLKYLSLIIFKPKILKQMFSLSLKFNFIFITIYLIFSCYFYNIYLNINIYFDQKLYSQSTYNEIRNKIYNNINDRYGQYMYKQALRNYDTVYNKPDNNFTKILNYIYKIPKESN